MQSIHFESQTEKGLSFVFFNKETPESIDFGLETKLNKIEYNGGFQTNQIIGVYRKEIEWDGSFFGVYSNGDVAITRLDALQKLVGHIVMVSFPMNGVMKPKQHYWSMDQYILESLTPTIKNIFTVDYKIKLTPHECPHQITPSKGDVVQVSTKPVTVSNAKTNVKKNGKKLKNGKAQKAVAKSTGKIKPVHLSKSMKVKHHNQ